MFSKCFNMFRIIRFRIRDSEFSRHLVFVCLFLTRWIVCNTRLLSNAVFSLFHIVPDLHTRQGHHYSGSHLQHQARSIIFQKNHYDCVFPRGRSYSGDNRSSGMMVSRDLITSGAKLGSEKWFLVLSVSLGQIHDGTKIAVMNSWLSKLVISVSGYCQLRGAVIYASLHRMICRCLGTYSTSHCVCEEVIKCYLSPSSL